MTDASGRLDFLCPHGWPSLIAAAARAAAGAASRTFRLDRTEHNSLLLQLPTENHTKTKELSPTSMRLSFMSNILKPT